MHCESESGNIIHGAGIRVTVPRVIVYDYISRGRTHPTCEEIYEALKPEHSSLSLASVYNVTDRLYAEGLLIRLIAPNGERRYDANTELHGHFYCEKCGGVFDFSCPRKDIRECLKDFVPSAVDISARGMCRSCFDSDKNNAE